MLTSFFTVRKPGSSQEENFKQKLTDGNVAYAVKKRKRGGDEEDDDGTKEDPPDTTTLVAAVEEHQTTPPIPKTPAAAGKTFVPSQKPDQEDQSNQGVGDGGKKKVTFHKLSGLSPRKAVRGGWEGASAMARAEATPEQQSTSIKPPPAKKRPTVSRNLFSDEDELQLKERTSDIARTVKTASEIKARLTPAEVKAKLGNVKLKDLKARLASLDSSRKACSGSSTGPVKVTARPSPGPVTAPPVLLVLDTPPCTPRKSVMPTPPNKQQKASPRKLPAFERFHSLTQPVCKALPLPYKYRCDCIDIH